MIEWKDGAVCFADGEQWYCRDGFLVNLNGGLIDVSNSLRYQDFQLNEIRQGDYIKASELDTEQKYNDAIDALELFGFNPCINYKIAHEYGNVFINDMSEVHACMSDHHPIIRKITCTQLMAIGKLKRAMIDRERSAGGRAVDIPDNTAEFDAIVSGKSVDTAGTGSNKSKQAYDILKALDYEYDLVKQRWYKKEWV